MKISNNIPSIKKMKIIYNVSLGHLYYLKKIKVYIKVHGISKAKKKVSEYFMIQIRINTWVNLKKINSTVKVEYIQ